ncbi:PAS domain S-box protein [Novipirellula caenicola]|uniref:histidine kinase n=1 Tax=Novipirellula caenicola TaxID=1536901 RepID=A0ABP9VX07_9BACT
MIGAICVLFLLVTQADAADTTLRTDTSGSLASCCSGGDCSTVAIAAGSEREFHAEGLATFFSKLVDTRDFPARWYCGTWSLDVGWLHIISDIAIFAAYFAIPLVLMGFVLHRRDLPFPRVIWLFAAFILSCGITHLIEAGLFWWPVYRLSGVMKACSAIISWATVVMLIRVTPAALKIPSAALLSKQLQEGKERLNLALEAGHVGVWEWDLNTDTFIWDSTTREILGIDADVEIDFDLFAAAVHPDDRDRVTQLVNNSLRSGCRYDTQYRVVHQDGTLHYVRAKGNVIYGTNAKPERFLGVCLDFTQQQLQEDAVWESQNNFQSTFEQVAMGIAHVSPIGKWLRVNKGLRDILGYSEEELLQSTFQDLTHPDDLNADMDNVQFLLDGRIESYSMEKRYIRKDGSLVWGKLTVSLVRDVIGNPKHFIAVIEDIQQRKDAEAKLREYTSQIRKLSLVASKTKHSVVICDAQGRIEWTNDAFTQLTGYTLDEAIGGYPTRLLQGPDTDPETINAINEAVQRGESIAVEILNYSKSGDEYWIDLKIDPVFDEQGELTQFIGTQVNITERKNAEIAMRQQQKRFQRFLQSDIVGIAIVRLSGEVVQANDEMLRIVGYTRGELDNQLVNWRAMTPDEYYARDEQAMTELLASGAVKPYEKELIRLDGSRVPIVIGATHLDDEDDLTLCFVLDATSQKETKAKLQSAKRVAEKANLAKSEFLAAMSHELRTPLNGVIGMTELLAETGLDARQQRFVNACQTSGKALMTLINDILDFSKIEAGHLELDQHRFDLLELLDDVMTSMPVRLEGKQIELLYHLDHPATLTLVGDSHRLRQVLFNLIGNAIKFTDRGEVTLLAEPQRLTESEATIRFSITDTGIGIPQDRINRLFQAFSQMDSSTSRQYGGTGLGLSISKGLVDLMGGSIGVQSEEGVGSRFWFTLTFKRLHVVKSRERIAAERVSNEQVHDLKVLVVEDNDECRRTLHSMLQGWKIKVQCVRNAEDAVQRLKQARAKGSPFDIALINKTLPGQDGIELGRRLREDFAFDDLLLFLMAPMDADFPPSNLVFDRFLTKPIGQSLLLDTIVDSCCRKRQDVVPETLAETLEQVQLQSDVRILVAEDNPTNQLYAAEILLREGWQCDIANNGREAVEAVGKSNYDLILMDCQMPEVDGYEATRQIRKQESDGRLAGHRTIVALTANAIKGDRELCLDAGMDEYLSKPFDPSQLVAMIRALLEGESVSFVNAAAEASPSADENQSDLPPIDFDSLYDRCMGDVSFATSLLDSFAEDGRDRMNQIIRLTDQGDVLAASKVAHSLKGIAGIVAAQEVQFISARIESAGKAGEIEVMHQLVGDLKNVVDECLSYVPIMKKRTQRWLKHEPV